MTSSCARANAPSMSAANLDAQIDAIVCERCRSFAREQSVRNREVPRLRPFERARRLSAEKRDAKASPIYKRDASLLPFLFMNVAIVNLTHKIDAHRQFSALLGRINQRRHQAKFAFSNATARVRRRTSRISIGNGRNNQHVDECKNDILSAHIQTQSKWRRRSRHQMRKAKAAKTFLAGENVGVL